MNEALIKTTIEAISQEIIQDPSNPYLYRERGRLLMLTGDRQSAMQDLQKALELDPNMMNNLNGEFHS